MENLNVENVEKKQQTQTETNTGDKSQSSGNVNGSDVAINKLPQVPKKGEDINIKYKGLTFEMASELHYYEKKYFTWDEPVPFIGKLKIYPVRMRDYEDFFDAVACFLLDKKDIPIDLPIQEVKKRMRMSDLDFLLSKCEGDSDETRMWLSRLVRLLEIVFNISNGIKCSQCEKILSYEEFRQTVEKAFRAQSENVSNTDEIKMPAVTCPECGSDKLEEMIRYAENEKTHQKELIIDGQVIDSNDFARLRNIVLFQNLPDYRDTSYVDPNLKKDYETRKRLQNKGHENLTATLEKKIISLKIGAGYNDYEQIYNLTARKFLMEMTTMDDLIMYKLFMQGRLCGLGGGSNDPVEHWIYKEEKDVYADGGYVSQDAMNSKLRSAQ